MFLLFNHYLVIIVTMNGIIINIIIIITVYVKKKKQENENKQLIDHYYLKICLITVLNVNEIHVCVMFIIFLRVCYKIQN